MTAILLRTIRDRWRSLLAFSLISLGMTWMYVALFPSFTKEADRFNELFASYPKTFLDAFGIESLSISTLENFLTMEQYSLIWPLLTIILGLSLAGSSLAAYMQGKVELLPTDNASVLAALPVLSAARDDAAGQIMKRALERMQKGVD